MSGNFRKYAASFWYQHVKSDAPLYDKVLEQMKTFFALWKPAGKGGDSIAG